MVYLQFATQADFNYWLGATDDYFGYPKPGHNAATGVVENPGYTPTLSDPRGWTITWCQSVDLLDGYWTAPGDETAVAAVGILPMNTMTQEEYQAAYDAAYLPPDWM